MNALATIGERIRLLRKEYSLTQTELGKILNTGKTTISNYETNYSTPDTDNIKKLADYFRVSIDYLIGRTDSRTEIIIPEGNLHKENILYKSYDEIFDKIKHALFQKGLIKDTDNIPPEMMEAIVKHGIEAASEILKARQQINPSKQP